MTNRNNESKNKDRTIVQMLKFLVIGGIGAVIQLIAVNALYYALKSWTAPLPSFLSSVFSETVMGKGNSNWGYVLPFFISNLISNSYQYVQNKKTTFKADAPKWSFSLYIAILIILIFIVTWTQGVLNNAFLSTGTAFFIKLAPTLSVLFSGLVYTLVLFPLEKFVLFKKKKEA